MPRFNLLLLSSLFFCLFLLFPGFTLNKCNAQSGPTAKVNGNVRGLEDGTKVFLIPNFPTGQRDSSVVKNGGFHFAVDIENGNSYSLRFSRSFEPGKWLDIYLEEGAMQIKGESGKVYDLRFSGSGFARDLDSYYQLLRKNEFFHRQETNTAKLKLSEETKDRELGKKAFEEYKLNDSLKSVLSKKWILKNPGSPVSAFALYSNVSRHISLDGLDSLLATLSAGARSNALAEAMNNKVMAARTLVVGNIAPDFTQPDTTGKKIALKDFRGKYVFVDFWASWCVPCRAENPGFVKALNRFSGYDFTILSISLDDKKDKWMEAIKKDNLQWTHVSDLRSWDNAASRKYAISSVPYNLLLDKEGKILAINLSGEELNKKLEDMFSK